MEYVATAAINPMTGYQSAVRITRIRNTESETAAGAARIILTFDSRHMWLQEAWRNDILVEQARSLFNESLEHDLNLIAWDTSFEWNAEVRRGSLIFEIYIYGPAIIAFLGTYPKARKGLVKLVQDLGYLARKAYYAAQWTAKFTAKVAQASTKSGESQTARRPESPKPHSGPAPSQIQAKPKPENAKYFVAGATSKPRNHP